MSQQKISDTKIMAITKMNELGFTTTKISDLLKVSRLTVRDHLNPESYDIRREKSTVYQRRTILGTGTCKANATVYKHLNKRPHPGICELCDKDKRLLHYHHWDDDYPEIGLWVCVKCHKIAGFYEGDFDVLRLMLKYVRLKAVLANSKTPNRVQSSENERVFSSIKQ